MLNRLLFFLAGLFILSACSSVNSFLSLNGRGDQNGSHLNVLVQEACCSCNNGGRLISVPESQVSSHQEKLRNKCSGEVFACSAWFRCPEWRKQCQESRCSEAVRSQLKRLPEK